MAGFVVATARRRVLGSPWVAPLGVLGAPSYGLALPLLLLGVPWAGILFPMIMVFALWLVLAGVRTARREAAGPADFRRVSP